MGCRHAADQWVTGRNRDLVGNMPEACTRQRIEREPFGIHDPIPGLQRCHEFLGIDISVDGRPRGQRRQAGNLQGRQRAGGLAVGRVDIHQVAGQNEAVVPPPDINKSPEVEIIHDVGK
ncbi:hypothetical protein D3C87_1362350 [compost metagenome]